MRKTIVLFFFLSLLNMETVADEKGFQSEREKIVWKIHFNSPPEKVYKALNTSEGRSGYWAESAIEKKGYIHYKFLNGIESTGKILERIPNERFSVTYFNWKVTFILAPDNESGTDMEMISEGVPELVKMEVVSGWVSWLMAMKAYVDFGVDLRNHDNKRTWYSGYVDN